MSAGVESIGPTPGLCVAQCSFMLRVRFLEVLTEMDK
jgi:hypothetical protein